jgi:flagellar protein FliT
MLIDDYKAIEDTSARMLDAARAADWALVAGFEGRCSAQIRALRQDARGESLNAAQRQEKTRILQRILRIDAQIRYLTEPWRARYECQFGGNTQRPAI